MKRILIVRHGVQDTSLFNADAPLSGKGRRQAELLRDSLCKEKFDLFYSSTLIRAVETADILNENWNMEIRRRPEINEMDWGDFTGRDIETARRENKDFFSRYAMRYEDLPYPGGECGEDAFRRARPVFREIEESSAESILMVAHGGLLRSVLAGLLGVPFRNKLVFSKYLENTSVTELLYDEARKLYYIERLNDHHHLDGHPELQRRRDL